VKEVSWEIREREENEGTQGMKPQRGGQPKNRHGMVQRGKNREDTICDKKLVVFFLGQGQRPLHNQCKKRGEGHQSSVSTGGEYGTGVSDLGTWGGPLDGGQGAKTETYPGQCKWGGKKCGKLN